MYYEFLQNQLNGFIMMAATPDTALGQASGCHANNVTRPETQTVDYTEYAA